MNLFGNQSWISEFLDSTQIAIICSCAEALDIEFTENLKAHKEPEEDNIQVCWENYILKAYSFSYPSKMRLSWSEIKSELNRLLYEKSDIQSL